jgi:hypothetical protein
MLRPRSNNASNSQQAAEHQTKHLGLWHSVPKALLLRNAILTKMPTPLAQDAEG